MVGCYTQSKGYRVYNKRTRLIVESIHIKFDEIKEMMSDHNSSDLAPQRQEMSVENVSLGLVPQGQKASDYDNSNPVPPRQNVVPTAEKTYSSQQGGTRNWTEGFDFEEIIAQLLAWKKLGLFVVAYAAHKSFLIYQYVVKTSFLNGPLKEAVYVVSQTRRRSVDPVHLRTSLTFLRKALYGLKTRSKIMGMISTSAD
ncbi:retrovirus-related pol polyprotein from transposon TNT 1-94 [Tanacetum coccineum]